jgi:cysteinyl-tRNA synthetase
VLAGCGSSAEDKAKDQVCNARDDIAKQVSSLQSLTVETATVDQVKSSLTSIQNDLKKISDAQGDLKGARKEQVQKANETFTSQVNTVANDLKSNLSLQGAAQQLQSAVTQLGNAYKQSFAQIDCS